MSWGQTDAHGGGDEWTGGGNDNFNAGAGDEWTGGGNDNFNAGAGYDNANFDGGDNEFGAGDREGGDRPRGACYNCGEEG